jgi:hypothetical protein
MIAAWTRHADERSLFRMFVRDISRARACMQVMQEYQGQPATLHRDLPHRDLEFASHDR